jgi:uncharacterized membrane protein
MTKHDQGANRFTSRAAAAPGNHVQRLGSFLQATGGTVLPAIFMVWALPVLLAMAWITPPWQNPDEPLHFARAVQVAHGGLIGSRAWGTAGGVSDGAIYHAYAPVQHAAMRPDQRLSLNDLALSGLVAWSPAAAYTSFPNTAQYPPSFYLPDAAAYWAGRIAGASINHTLLLARLLNAALFCAIAAAALAIAVRTRLLLLAVAMLPTTLSLACSASQDSLMQAATMLAVAIIDRVVAQQRSATPREAALATLLLACVAMARPPYAGFLLALGLLSPSPWRTLARTALPAALAVAAWCLAVALHTSVRLGGADIGRQLALLGAHPGSIPIILAATLREYTGGWWAQFIAVLGWTDTPLPHAYIVFASLVLASVCLATPNAPWRRPWLPAAGVAFSVAAILVLQYLTWTWPGQPVVTGVLGRYFTAPAMIAALCLPRFGAAKPAAFAGLLALGAITPAVIVHTLLLRYYLS